MCALASYLHWAGDNLGSTQWLKMTINLALLKKIRLFWYIFNHCVACYSRQATLHERSILKWTVDKRPFGLQRPKTFKVKREKNVSPQK